jgi:hypothetical protein
VNFSVKKCEIPKSEAKMAQPEPKDSINVTVAKLITDWLDLHKDETFDLDMLCRQLDITARDARSAVSKRLSRLVDQKVLEKNNRNYRYANTDITHIDWTHSPEQYFDITFPSSHHPDDLSYFDFENAVRLSTGSLIVIAGVGNAGKSTWSRNMLWDNMHKFHCVYMSSETTGAAFRRYANRMTWANPMKTDKPDEAVFELIERYRDFQDITKNGVFSIVDWLDSPEGKFYLIGQDMHRIKDKNPDGITLINIQKDPGKALGRGDTFSKELASLYLTIDYDKEHNLNRLTVEKAKEWVGDHDPNNKVYGFQITDFGTQLSNIREIKKCKACYGFGRKGNTECVSCNGVGWVDGYRVTHKPIESEQTQLEVEDEIPF